MTLHLTLKKVWFDLMISGIKKIEYRKPSNWIQQRLHNKDYTQIKFVNGYGNDKPYFVCKYEGYTISQENNRVVVSDKLIEVQKGDYLIKLGEITERGNI